MKKRLLILSAAILGFAFSVNAQSSYSLSPNDTIVGECPLNAITPFDIFQTNNSSSNITLAWTRVSMNIPAGWDYSLCDYTQCYTGIPNSGTMSVVSPTSTGFLAVNINPYAINGTAVIRIYVYDMASPSTGDTLTWLLSTPPLGVQESFASAFTCFPNPATENLTIHASSFSPEGTTFSIVDMNGRIVSTPTKIVADETHVDISMLKEGVYFLHYTSPDGQVSVQRFMKTN